MAKRKNGRPSTYKPDFHPDDFVALSKEGKVAKQIAAIWDINVDTLYEWAKKHPRFSEAMRQGRVACEAWYIELGQMAMVGKATYKGQPVKVNLGYYAWLTRNLFKWSRPDDRDVSQPVQVEQSPETKKLEQLPDDKLTDIIVK